MSEHMTLEKANDGQRASRMFNEEVMWRGVEMRDVLLDGSFVYGVRSTNIYCRPTCPARRPARQQVSFFRSTEAAEAAGFRACLRCKPQAAIAPYSQTLLVQRLCRLIEDDEDGELDLAALSARVGLSLGYVQRTFKRMVGVSPRQYGEAHRTVRFKQLIRQGEAVTDAMYEAGYGSSSRLYEKTDGEFGMTPAVYRRGGTGMQITYAIVACLLGRLLVAATVRGLCAVSLGDTEKELEQSLAAEFHTAEIVRDDTALNEQVDLLLKHFDGQQPSLDLPLDVQATAFQRRVWEELRRIPYGSTRSYRNVASAIGQPSATRAVARACATNPVALVTPCHRVVRENGDLSGYRWGVERKQALLTRELRKADEEATMNECENPNECEDPAVCIL